MRRGSLSLVLLVISIVLAAMAVVTLAPHHARTVSDLGYYTLCPFAPWSTLTLLFLAGLSWVVRRHIDAQGA